MKMCKQCTVPAAEWQGVELAGAEHSLLGDWKHQWQHDGGAGKSLPGDSHPRPAESVRDHAGEGQQGCHCIQHHVCSAQARVAHVKGSERKPSAIISSTYALSFTCQQDFAESIMLLSSSSMLTSKSSKASKFWTFSPTVGCQMCI